MQLIKNYNVSFFFPDFSYQYNGNYCPSEHIWCTKRHQNMPHVVSLLTHNVSRDGMQRSARRYSNLPRVVVVLRFLLSFHSPCLKKEMKTFPSTTRHMLHTNKKTDLLNVEDYKSRAPTGLTICHKKNNATIFLLTVLRGLTCVHLTVTAKNNILQEKT